MSLKGRFESALTRPLDPKRTMVINGLPMTDAEYDVLAAQELQGPRSLWLPISQNLDRYLRQQKLPVRRLADRGLRNSADILVLFAHSTDGKKVLLPTKHGAVELQAKDLARFSEDFHLRKPTILLMSCSTGGVGESSPAMAQQLIALGAGAVIAPKDPIDARVAQEFLDTLLHQDPSMSLVARVSIALRDPRFGEGNIRFLVFRTDPAHPRQKPLYELLSSGTAGPDGPRTKAKRG